MLVSLNRILENTRANHYAVPAFNTSSNMILTGVIEACEKNQSPVIIMVHPDELHFTKHSFIAAVREEANAASIPVCIHLDHGQSFEQVMEAIHCGYTSVMIDASLKQYGDNVEITRKVVEASHLCGVSVEAEIGTIGPTIKGGIADQDHVIYTNPDDAIQFIQDTGIDALAVAIGTAHGLYPKERKPKLRMDILDEIVARTACPLVLHGGSDNAESEIADAVYRGISKVNISADVKSAFYNRCREVLKDLSLREPNQIYPSCIEAMKVVVEKKIHLFNSQDKAKLYF